MLISLFFISCEEVHYMDIDIDDNGFHDIKVYKNTKYSMIVLKNEIHRKGIEKFVETIDLSYLSLIEERIKSDRIQTDALKIYSKVKSEYIEYHCPNFRYNGYIDDIESGKFEELVNQKVRIFHAEFPKRDDYLRFLGKLSKFKHDKEQ